jgi:predicted DNA-binding transcriptional regulator AlpA
MHPVEYRKLSTREAAARLGISASTLAKLRCVGGGPVYAKLGRRVVYGERDLDDWADARRRTSTSDNDGSISLSARKQRAVRY